MKAVCGDLRPKHAPVADPAPQQHLPSWKTRLSADAVEELVLAQAHEMVPEKRLSLERIRMAY